MDGPWFGVTRMSRRARSPIDCGVRRCAIYLHRDSGRMSKMHNKGPLKSTNP